MYLLISILILGILFLLVCIGIGCYFYQKAIYAHSKKAFILTDPHTKVTKEDQWYLQYAKYQNVHINSRDGLCLHGSVVPGVGTAWVILVHGYMGRLEDMIPQAKAFHERGYYVLLVDLRGHGKSEGDVIGFGYLDHFDLLDWIDFLKQRGAISILLYGVSMGASTLMLCSDEVDQHVTAIIEDCGFSTLDAQLNYIVKHMVKQVPSRFLVFCLSLVIKSKGGYRISDVNCLRHVAKSRVPILFLHGERDGFIEIKMMEELYDACPTSKQQIRIPKARHANSAKLNPELYWNSIDDFLGQLDSKPTRKIQDNRK